MARLHVHLPRATEISVDTGDGFGLSEEVVPRSRAIHGHPGFFLDPHQNKKLHLHRNRPIAISRNYCRTGIRVKYRGRALRPRARSALQGVKRSPVTTGRNRRPNIPNPRASEGWTAASHASASNSARTESSITASRKIVTTIPLNYLPALVTPKLSPTGVTWKWVTLPN